MNFILKTAITNSGTLERIIDEEGIVLDASDLAMCDEIIDKIRRIKNSAKGIPNVKIINK